MMSEEEWEVSEAGEAWSPSEAEPVRNDGGRKRSKEGSEEEEKAQRGYELFQVIFMLL